MTVRSASTKLTLRRGRRKPTDWTALGTLYAEDDTLTLADIAERSGRSLNTVKHRSDRHHWAGLRRVAQAKRTERLKIEIAARVETFDRQMLSDLMDIATTHAASLKTAEKTDAFQLVAILRELRDRKPTSEATLTLPAFAFAILPKEDVANLLNEARASLGLPPTTSTPTNGSRNGHAESPYSRPNGSS